MEGLRRYVVLGAAGFIVFLIATFPASTAFVLFAPDGAGAFGIEGTIWRGKARLISLQGQQFRNTEWDVAALRLLTGRFGGDFKTRWAGGFIEGTGGISLTGTISLQNLRGSFDIAPVSRAFGTPQIGGIANVRFSEVEIVDNWPRRLVGDGELRNLSSPLMGRGEAQMIGNVGFAFDTGTETDRDTITGRLRDTGGPLELNGTLLLTPPGNYELKSRVKPRPDAPAALRRNLQFLGAPEPDGTHLFQLAGSV